MATDVRHIRHLANGYPRELAAVAILYKMATTAPDLNETNLTYTSELTLAARIEIGASCHIVNGYHRARFECNKLNIRMTV